MSQTLFLKDNVPHIRLKEGEQLVSNPEVLTCLHIRHMPDGDWRIKTPDSGWTGEDVKWPVEWPYGVELIDMLQIRVGNEWKNLLFQNDYKGNMESTRIIKVARLLPEEKKDNDLPVIEPGFLFPKNTILGPSESAYKEGESSEPQEKKDQYGNPVFDIPEEEAEYRKKTLEMANRIIDGLTVNKANFEHIAQTGNINGSLRQELIDKIFSKLPVSAPSESQEDPVLFADWLIKNGWEPQMTEGCWIQYAEEPIMKKTTELYHQFKSKRNP